MGFGRIVHTTPAGPLVGGLTWLPCAPTDTSRRALRRAAEPHQATHAVVVHGPQASCRGLCIDDDDSLPRQARSAAAQFAGLHQGVEPDTPAQSALVLRLRPEHNASTNDTAGPLYFAVLVEHGVPLAELIGPEDRVRSLLADFSGRLFSDTPTFGGEPLTWETLAEARLSATRLRRIPANPWPAVGALVLLAAAGGSAWAWQAHRSQQALAAAQVAARDADPVPRYLSALQAQRQVALVQREHWRAVWREVMALPSQVPGWQLQAVDCARLEARCSAQWIRRGGTWRELAAALPRHQWLRPTDLRLDLDRATTSWPITLQAQALGTEPPTLEAFARDAGTTLQRWRTAQLGVEMRPPTLWPSVAGVPPTLTHPQALRRAELSVTQIPAAFLAEVLTQAPSTIAWSRLRVEVADTTGAPIAAARTLMASVSGVLYVR